MDVKQATHLFTEEGTLCGASAAGWQSLYTGSITCPLCLELVQLEPFERGPAVRRAVVVVAKSAKRARA
jgi:hypothetical protein